MKKFTFFLIFTSMALLLKSQDWANLSRYALENEQVDSKNEGRVVFMGNSITEGWINQNPDFFRGKPYINRGIGGQTTPQMLLRFRQDVIDLNPKLVVILAGTNDIAGNTGNMTLDQTMNNLISMAELATANNIQVILCSVLPAKSFYWNPSQNPAPRIVELNSRIRAYAVSKGHGYVDYHSSMKDAEDGLKVAFGEDGVHPNLQGYKLMEPLIEKAIIKALKN